MMTLLNRLYLRYVHDMTTNILKITKKFIPAKYFSMEFYNSSYAKVFEEVLVEETDILCSAVFDFNRSNLGSDETLLEMFIVSPNAKIRGYKKKHESGETTLVCVYIDVLDDYSKTIASMKLVIPVHGLSAVMSFFTDEVFSDYIYRIIFTCYQSICSIDKILISVDIFSSLLSVKDPDMPYHMFNVSHIAMNIGVDLNLDEVDMDRLMIASLLHDIGKIVVSDRIVSKHSVLTPEEYDEIKVHSALGEMIAEALFVSFHEFHGVSKIIRHHHERIDGRGYPDGIEGDAIPLLSRIISIADAIDSMRSVRSFKPAYSDEKIIRELKKYSKTQFDERIVESAIKILNKRLSENDIKNFSMIPTASLVVFYGTYEKNIYLVGNLFVTEHDSRFIIHTKLDESLLDPHVRKKGRLFFISNNESYEYNVNITSMSSKEILLSNIEIMHSETFFSINWDISAELYTKKEHTKAKIFKVSADHICLLSELNDSAIAESDYISFLKGVNRILFTLELDEESFTFEFSTILTDFYPVQSGWYSKFKFVNQTDNDRDKLVRVMFKKQVQNRRYYN